MARSEEEYKTIAWRALQGASNHLGWWQLTKAADGRYHFDGGFASGNTVELYGDSLGECLERVDDLMSEGKR
ncbi:MAG: hypothetical protein Q8P22_14045 [Chloroflexota bacterium]|nr:hypothetical protein [Chloroflexota bacterium]